MLKFRIKYLIPISLGNSVFYCVILKNLNSCDRKSDYSVTLKDKWMQIKPQKAFIDYWSKVGFLILGSIHKK